MATIFFSLYFKTIPSIPCNRREFFHQYQSGTIMSATEISPFYKGLRKSDLKYNNLGRY